MSNMTKTIAILGVVAGLGVAALPLSTYAANPEGKTSVDRVVSEDNKTVDSYEAQINVVIEQELSIATGKPDLTLDKDNQYTGSFNVNVINTTGEAYKLLVKLPAGSDGNLVQTEDADGGTTDLNGDPIVPMTGTGALTIGEGTNSIWGVKLTNGENAGSFTAVTTAGVELRADGAASTSTDGEDTEVTFGAAIKAGQANGTYSGNVVFTASNVQ